MTPEKQQIISDAIRYLSDIYHEAIWKNSDVLNYLVGTRGLTEDTIREYRIGYASNRILSKSEMQEDIRATLKEYNLVGDKYDFFDGYITFPIFNGKTYHNVNGRAFGENNIPHKTVTDIKKDMPYNPKALQKTAVVIVESPIDALTLVQAGFNAVAVLSASMSQNMISLFDGISCYVMLDTDDSGRIGTTKIISKLWGTAHKLYDIEIPGKTGKKEDANSYFCRNKQAKARLRFLLKNSWPIIEAPSIRPPQRKTGKSNELDSEVDIVALGRDLFKGSYVIDKANELWVRCPHHKQGLEKIPSLRIGGKKNIFYCHGCQIGGGPVRLVHWHLNLEGWDEAVSWLEDWVSKNKY